MYGAARYFNLFIESIFSIRIPKVETQSGMQLCLDLNKPFRDEYSLIQQINLLTT